MTPRPIADVLGDLQSRTLSSLQLVESCLSRIADPAGEGSRTFTRVYANAAHKTAEEIDERRHRGEALGPLAGLPISVKDLFDVAGYPTTAGSLVLQNAPHASRDCTVVQRLKAADAVIIGSTNMTEFAYSGLGLNPHYGTPRNPFDRDTGRIPGGSSSGAAVSVIDGMAAAAIGTDTGGSVRIPAALCGLAGFKPTARRIPMDGMVPLSPSLDSVGPLAPTVACCALIDSVLSGTSYRPPLAPSLPSLRLGILQGYVLDSLDDHVGSAFARAIDILESAGASVEPIQFSRLEEIPSANQFAATEAYAWHRNLLAQSQHQYDPHVAYRIQPGASMLAADYIRLTQLRQEIISDAQTELAAVDAILLPATQSIAPPIAELVASDDDYFHANGAMLRNTSVFNYLDGTALSVPMHEAGEAPTGIMIAGLRGSDQTILRAGITIETALQNALRR